jgi:ferredoxin
MATDGGRTVISVVCQPLVTAVDNNSCLFACLLLLRRDPDAHKKFLKPSPLASELVDRCIECGFCESNCPSRDITLTPRCVCFLLTRVMNTVTCVLWLQRLPCSVVRRLHTEGALAQRSALQLLGNTMQHTSTDLFVL